MRPEGHLPYGRRSQLLEWTDCYEKAMGTLEFPYFHVEQVSTPHLNLALTVLSVPESGLDCLICARIWP